jgi:hypothetical protein
MGGCLSCESGSKKPSLESSRWSDCSLEEFEKRVNPLIDNIKLSKYRRNILKKRYTKLVIYYENYAADINKKYNICRLIISVGSMILPTLQTIQNNESVASYKDEIFWAAIGTSLSVMISNNLISMFSLDRKYVMYAVTAEKLKAVGWKYFELSDMFSTKTHIENWVLFWNEVEKIKKLQVIAEFTDNDDKSHEPNPAGVQSPVQSDNDDSDSDNTPRSVESPPPKSHRKHPKSSRKHKKNHRHNEEEEDDEDEDYSKNNVVIDLQNIPQTRTESIQTAQNTFKQNFNNSNLRTSIENNITTNVNDIQEDIEANVNETLSDLGKEIHSNLKNKNE